MITEDRANTQQSLKLSNHVRHSRWRIRGHGGPGEVAFITGHDVLGASLTGRFGDNRVFIVAQRAIGGALQRGPIHGSHLQ